MHRVWVFVATVLALSCLAACAGSSSGGVAAQVGGVAVDRAAVEHWAAVTAVTRPEGGSPAQSPTARALGYLIASRWLIGEADEEGMHVSGQEVDEHLQARIESYANGRAEFDEVIKSRRETVADVTFEIESELAADRIHRMLVAREDPITTAQELAYYTGHKASFVAPEERKTVVWSSEIEQAAGKLKREVELGRNLAEVEERKLLTYVRHPPRNALEVAIYSAPVNRVIGPVTVGPNHFVFEVRHVVPARPRTFAQVKGKIESRLAGEQRHRVLLAFVTEWERKWRAKTNCSAGYVIRRCSQSTATVSTPEIPASLE